MKKYEKIFNGLVTDDNKYNTNTESSFSDNENKFEIKIIRKDNKKRSIDYNNNNDYDNDYDKYSFLNKSNNNSKSNKKVSNNIR